MSQRAVRPVRVALGKRVRDLRLQLGLSQHRLAAQCRLSGKFIGEVERGKKSISVDSLCRVASALGVSVAQLVEDEATPRRASGRTAAEIVTLLQRQRDPEVRRALRLLRAFFAKR